MSLPRTLVRSLADVLPAIVLTGLVAVAMSRAVPELDGRLVVIGAAGLIGIAAAEAVGATLRRLMPELPGAACSRSHAGGPEFCSTGGVHTGADEWLRSFHPGQDRFVTRGERGRVRH